MFVAISRQVGLTLSKFTVGVCRGLAAVGACSASQTLVVWVALPVVPGVSTIEVKNCGLGSLVPISHHALSPSKQPASEGLPA
jgi:hypothetical protein